MGDSYLSSDESLILSTQNIRIDGRSRDLMLTSRRLILIDNSVTPFHLRTIPLDMIITVIAGMDVKGDPIITLSHMDPSGAGAPHPVDFIFTRQKGEQRTKECNEWAATLNIYAAEARKGSLSSGTLPYDPVKVIQPRMSATYRIETFSPRKPVMEAYPGKTSPVTLPVPSKSLNKDGIPKGSEEPAQLKNAKMVEAPDSSWIPTLELDETEMPLIKEPVSPPQEIAIGPDKNLEIIDAKEPVSPPPVIPIDSDKIQEIAGADEPVSPPQVIPIDSDKIQEIADAEEPVSPPQVIPVDSDKIQEITGADEPVSPPQVIPIDSDKIQEIADAEEPVSPPQVIPVDSDKIQEIADAEEPVSPPQVIPIEPEENQASTDNAQIWADAVRTALSPSPAIPLILQDSVDNKPKEPSAPKAAPAPAAISSSAPKDQKQSPPTMMIAAIIVIILVVLGVAIISSLNLRNSGDTPPPLVVSFVTVQPTPTPIPTLVPADGVWVRIVYPGTFIGEVGNTELIRPVSGSGAQIYKILWNDRIVQVLAQKQDNSGDTLLIEVYNNGTLIKSSSTRKPMGSINFLIDPITGQPPGFNQGDNP
jgi:hypothetical protein